MTHASRSFPTSSVISALVILANLTEDYKLGGAPGHDLSYMIERGDVCRELVDARIAKWPKIACVISRKFKKRYFFVKFVMNRPQ